jgi:uncharacterized membrane protein YraQ (UPF0718 family)/copper chaperone CopZ
MNMIIDNFNGLVYETWNLLNLMSPYLLLGFLMAGILYILIPKELIYKHFSKDNLSGVTKASLFGVPLPLCSCGIIPVSAYFRKEGAGKAATLAFLTSTPTTGVDSILATYSLLGPLFAIIRPIASFFSGLLAGALHIFIEKEEQKKITPSYSCTVCDENIPHKHKWADKIKKVFTYGLFDLVKETWKWLAIGIIIGGILTFYIPSDIMEKYLSNSFISYPLMLIFAIPFYVCATGSIPIVSALILKGLNPGAGFVFLFAGPATNTATLSFVGGKLGKKSLLIYLITIISSAIFFGLFIDYIWYSSGKDINLISGSMVMIPQWLRISSSIILIALIINVILPKARENKALTGDKIIIKVNDMTCTHCVKTIDSAIKKLDRIIDVRINLKNKEVTVTGGTSKEQVMDAIKDAGYSIN